MVRETSFRHDVSDAYERRKERERQRQADQSRTGRDIGPIPPVRDPALRKRVSRSLKAFCEVCFPRKFYLGWSPDHIEVLARIETCITEGQLYTLAMPRGSGKTTMVVAACLWAILTGRRKFVTLIGADREAAKKLLDACKAELESNDMLLALFPEAVFPIRCLEGKGNKATGQLHLGKRTYIEWKGPQIVFPSIRTNVGSDAKGDTKPASKRRSKGSSEDISQTIDEKNIEFDPKHLTPCSGAIIATCGILGRVRGMVHTDAAGNQLRPDLFVLDDPQTDRSAISTSQVNRRLSIITGAVLGLAGPDIAIAGFATVTVMVKDDVADQLLDREKFPDWQGKRYQLVYRWPDRMDLWEQYAVLRAEGLRLTGTIEEATRYYEAHRSEMDRGAKVAWEDRKKPGEVSALQSAFNHRLRSPATFDAEFQNNPADQTSDVDLLTVEEIEAKISNYLRGELPIDVNLATAFIDVQGNLLYWIVLGWDRDSFTGYVLEYGSWPEQVSKHYTLRNAQNTLTKKYPRKGLEGRLTAGLNDLVNYLGGQRYRLNDGSRLLGLDLIGIDQAWGPSTKTVRSVCASHPHRALLLPCQGKSCNAGDRSINEWAVKSGELRGDHWIIRTSSDGGRHCLADSNQYKSFVNARLNVATGDPGSLTLYRPTLATEHRLIAEHWRAEKAKTISDGDRSIEQWKLPPNKPDNHWWDGLYWNAVLASVRGARLGAYLPIPKSLAKKKNKPKRRPTSLIA